MSLPPFDLVKQLRLQEFIPTIIFVTAHNKYAIEAIRHAAFDFLVKPVEASDLQSALDRLPSQKPYNLENKIDLLLAELEGKHKIKLDSSGSFILVDPNEIIYCQADWNYSEVYLTGDRREVLSMSIGKLEERLISSRFFRINRSIIINIDYLVKVKRILRKCILKQNGQEYSFSIPRANIRELEKRMEG